MASTVGTIPANTSGADTLFGYLLEFQWRGIGVPTEKFTTEIRQDLVIHKFADRDGAHIESTGRHPFQITATIPFIVGINAGLAESWVAYPLYPDQFRKFFIACTDNTSGTLQHPELGPLTCKCESARFTWSAHRRGGVDVEASWIESDDTTGDLTAALSTASPLAGLTSSAADFDVQLAAPNFGAVPPPFVPKFTFSSLVQSITADIDQFTVLAHQVTGQLNAMVYSAQQVTTALNLASNALQWPLQLSASKTIEAARTALTQVIAKGKPVSKYTVLKDSTMGQLATSIPADIGDLINLNPTLLQSFTVPAQTVVNFYPI